MPEEQVASGGISVDRGRWARMVPEARRLLGHVASVRVRLLDPQGKETYYRQLQEDVAPRAALAASDTTLAERLFDKAKNRAAGPGYLSSAAAVFGDGRLRRSCAQAIHSDLGAA